MRKERGESEARALRYGKSSAHSLIGSAELPSQLHGLRDRYPQPAGPPFLRVHAFVNQSCSRFERPSPCISATMEDQPAAASGSGHKTELQLNIISPMATIQKLSFPNISTSCTIAELKQKISDASETREPLPPQQRLIYRGHVLAPEQRTLGDVFGQETVRHP